MTFLCTCGGRIDPSTPLRIADYPISFPCEDCGKIHYLSGDEVHKTPKPLMEDIRTAYLSEGKVLWV